MFSRFARVLLSVSLLIALWGLTLSRRPNGKVWLRPLGARPAPVRIVRFYAAMGAVAPGQATQLCYSVENARSVRIAPMQRSFPAEDRCLDIAPEHTTHYTLLAEGYDGTVAARSFTLAVETPADFLPVFQYARRRSTTTRSQSPVNS